MTPEQYHRHELVIPLPALFDVAQLEASIAAGRYNALVRQIVGGYESTWDGSRRVGTYTDDAEGAITALRDALDGAPTLDIVKSPAAGFTVRILIEVAESALESFANDQCSEEEYDALVDAYGAELAQRVQELYPGRSVEYAVRSLPGEEPYRVRITVSHGGSEAATRWQREVERVLEEMDHETIVASASAAAFEASHRI